MFRKSFLITGSTATISYLLPLILHQSVTLLTWTNTLFLCSLMLIMAGATLFVIQGQFFSGIFRSFKHFFGTVSRMEKIIRDVEGKKDDTIPYHQEFGLTFPLLVAGLVLFIFSFALSLTF
jgi:hypothetical protein